MSHHQFTGGPSAHIRRRVSRPHPRPLFASPTKADNRAPTLRTGCLPSDAPKTRRSLRHALPI